MHLLTLLAPLTNQCTMAFPSISRLVTIPNSLYLLSFIEREGKENSISCSIPGNTLCSKGSLTSIYRYSGMFLLCPIALGANPTSAHSCSVLVFFPLQLCISDATAVLRPEYGLSLAYYVDQDKIFAFVERQGTYVKYPLGFG